MAEWWDKNKDFPLKDENFQRVLDFFLFHCPSEIEKVNKKKGTKTYSKVSKSAETLRMKGWTGGYLNTLLASMKHTSSGQLEYQIFKADTSIAEKVKALEKDIPLRDKHFEMIAYAERSDMNKTSAIFYYVRNAFAHGSFCVISVGGKKIYYLESAKDTSVKAQIRLREETLLKWIRDFSTLPVALKETLKYGRKQRKLLKEEKGNAA